MRMVTRLSKNYLYSCAPASPSYLALLVEYICPFEKTKYGDQTILRNFISITNNDDGNSYNKNTKK